MLKTLENTGLIYCLQIEVETPPQEATWNLLSEVFFSNGALGISEGEVTEAAFVPSLLHKKTLVEGQGPITADELDEFAHALAPGCLNPPHKFQVFFGAETEAQFNRDMVAPALQVLGVKNCQIEKVESVDYDSIFREGFKPIRLSHWNILAPWHEDLPHNANPTIMIEPGMAFGTGTHETTQMCLEFLWQVANENVGSVGTLANKQVLDFGCGSGILALAALKLKCQLPCIALDIDPLALKATEKNLALNSDLPAEPNALQVSKTLPQNFSENETFDLILANLLKNTIFDFANEFFRILKPGGVLIVSGVLTSQLPSVVEKLLEFGFSENPAKAPLVTGEWCAIYFEKRKK